MSVLAAASTSAFDQPGTLGFLVVAGMAIVLTFLFRSMSKHLRKVSGTGRAGVPGGQADAAAGPDSAGAVQAQATAADEAGSAARLGSADGTGSDGSWPSG